ncbi:hypothetical protein J7J81_03490 [bacterium]|nr:hypothetical protein [bacterium]
MSKKLILISSIGSAIALIGVMAALLYTNVWSPVWNPFHLSPAEAIEEVLQKMDKVQNYHLKVDSQLTTGNNQGILSFSLDGVTDKSQKAARKKDYIFSLKLSALGQPMLFVGEAKTLGDISYVKITNFPSVPILTMLGLNPATFQNKWIKIDKNSLASTRKRMGIYKGEEGTKTEKEKLTQEITDLFDKEKTKIIKIGKELKDEKVNGKSAYHYLAQCDTSELKKVLLKLNSLIVGQPSLFNTPKEKEDWQKFTKVFFQEYDGIAQKIGKINFEIWIGKRDKLLRRIKLAKGIDLTEFVNPEKISKMSIKKVNILLDISLSDFDQKVEINPPSTAESVEDIISKMGFAQNLLQQYKSSTGTLNLFNNQNPY